VKIVETKFEEYLNELMNYLQRVMENLQRTEFSENEDEDEDEMDSTMFLFNEK
jgi:hypothetical protein